MATAPSDMPATPNMWCAYETRNQRVPPPRRPACASELSRHSPPTPQGEFAANQYEGHGTYTFPDGSSYEGAFQAGQMHGAGCYLDKQARPAAQRVPSVERAPLRPSRTTHSPLAAHPVATASRRRESPCAMSRRAYLGKGSSTTGWVLACLPTPPSWLRELLHDGVAL